eukprot:1316300-Amorphochlora_amoeboformis.AAC.2
MTSYRPVRQFDKKCMYRPVCMSLSTRVFWTPGCVCSPWCACLAAEPPYAARRAMSHDYPSTRGTR